MKIETLHTEKAPAAIGPYSQAVKAGDFLFLSGQIPIDPESGEMVASDITLQTRQVLYNLQMVLESQGLGFSNVVETTIFMVDLKDFAVVNRIYQEAMGEHRPARVTVQVAGLPKEALVEIKMTACF
ncbi:MAG: RidA family protein [Spirochaetales bacterium]|nr:RidA family protein [Spirochaetales bacterium]